MASIKSDETLHDAEKAVQARQNGPEPFDENQYQIVVDKCKYQLLLPASICLSLTKINHRIPHIVNRNIVMCIFSLHTLVNRSKKKPSLSFDRDDKERKWSEHRDHPSGQYVTRKVMNKSDIWLMYLSRLSFFLRCYRPVSPFICHDNQDRSIEGRKEKGKRKNCNFRQIDFIFLAVSPPIKRIVLVVCGSFNPVTIAHLRMLELARDYYHLRSIQVLEG